MLQWLTFSVCAMKSELALIFVLSLVACSGGDGGAAGLRVLSWSAPVQREGNAIPLSLGEIAGYNLYYKTVDGNYYDHSPVFINDSDNVAIVRVRLGDIPVQPGSYLIVVTTVDSDGRESAFSAPELGVTF